MTEKTGFDGQPPFPGAVSLRDRPKEYRTAISKVGGSSTSFKKIAAVLENNPKFKMTEEQRHFVALLRNDQFVTAIKDMLVFIALKAKTADDYHKLLVQIMKLPFIAKVYQDLNREKQEDIIPIVIRVLRDNNQEHLIPTLIQELRRGGYHGHHTTTPSNDRDTTVSDMRPTTESAESQDRIMAGALDEASDNTDVLHLRSEDGDGTHKRGGD